MPISHFIPLCSNCCWQIKCGRIRLACGIYRKTMKITALLTMWRQQQRQQRHLLANTGEQCTVWCQLTSLSLHLPLPPSRVNIDANHISFYDIFLATVSCCQVCLHPACPHSTLHTVCLLSPSLSLSRIAHLPELCFDA